MNDRDDGSTPPTAAAAELIERARRGTNSLKWDSAPAQSADRVPPEDVLAMWVADMDFASPQPVIDALHEAVDFGIFGYSAGPAPGYLDAVVGWQGRRFAWQVTPAWIVPTSGVITAVKTAIQAFSSPGDSILIQPPVYAHFHQDVLINGRHLATAPLTRTDNRYRFDARAFEAAIQPNTRMFILSHPHNPTGNVWTEDELRTMGEICARHDVLVVSDEIHEDLVLDPDRRHIPFASLGPEFARNSITCTAASKTFNLPGLQCAAVIVSEPHLRDRFTRQYERNVYPTVNMLGMVATEAAYSHGEPWLTTLLEHLRGQHDFLAAAVHGATDTMRVLPTESLYLAWMDCRAFEPDAEALERFMLTQARLRLDPGQKFGAEGHGYVRVNLACSRETLTEATDRLVSAIADTSR